MGAWSDIVQQGSYKKVAFDFVSTRDEIGRVVDRQRIYGRPGQRLVDKTSEPHTFDILAIFVEDDYPKVMNDLIAAIEEGGIGEFVHPIFGAFRAMVTHASIDHSAEDAIDSGTMQLRVEEHSDTTQGPTATTTSPAAKASAVRAAVLDVLNAVSVYAGAADAVAGNTAAITATIAANIAACTAAANIATAAADNFDANGDTMSAIEVQATANGVLSAVDAMVTALSSCETNGEPLPEQYDLLQALIVMASGTRTLAETVAAGKPQIRTFAIGADISLLAWAHAQYGDSSRADEVLALNPSIVDPLLLIAGTELLAYAQ